MVFRVMVKRLSIYALGVLCVLPLGLAQADPQDCDVTYQDDVIWPAAGETVTLRYEVKRNDAGYIDHNVFMGFADGFDLKLPMGLMCLDQARPCQEIALELHSTLKESFNDKPVYVGREVSTMGEFAALLADESFCAQELNPYAAESYASEAGQAKLTRIEKSDLWQSEFLSCHPVLENITFEDGAVTGMTKDRFWQLAAENAPILDVPYAYGAESYVYDAQTRELIPLFSSGC